jgi:hypothetical protein
MATDPYPHTRVHLKSELLNCYDRTATTVNANVGLATQGMSVTEILGSGSAATPNQTFSLKQVPLTFVQSPTPTGRASTLTATVDNVAWKEEASLYQQPRTARVFAESGEAPIFSAMESKVTLPTGQNNIRASYFMAPVSAGTCSPGAIMTLMDRLRPVMA